MQEISGDLWSVIPVQSEDNKVRPKILRVITTNGFVKNNGELVMGAGCALQAKKKNPYIPKIIGEDVKENGNTVLIYNNLFEEFDLATFPVKNVFWERARLSLIRKSCRELRYLTRSKYDCVVLPKPGCGNGKLEWEKVRPVLEEELPEPIYCVITEWN